MKFVHALAALFAAVAISSPAYAVNIVTNGSFETGNTSGWTTAGGTCTWDSLTAGATTSGAAVFTAPAPTNGTRILLGDDTNPNQTCDFFQDIVIPASTTNSLTFDAGTNFNISANTLGDALSIDVLTTANVVLLNLYTRNGTQGNQAIAARGPFNLNAYAGTTIRLRVHRTNVAGPVGVIWDNIVLNSVSTVPTLSEWAMILLGLSLAGAGVVFMRRKTV